MAKSAAGPEADSQEDEDDEDGGNHLDDEDIPIIPLNVALPDLNIMPSSTTVTVASKQPQTSTDAIFTTPSTSKSKKKSAAAAAGIRPNVQDPATQDVQGLVTRTLDAEHLKHRLDRLLVEDTDPSHAEQVNWGQWLASVSGNVPPHRFVEFRRRTWALSEDFLPRGDFVLDPGAGVIRPPVHTPRQLSARSVVTSPLTTPLITTNPPPAFASSIGQSMGQFNQGQQSNYSGGQYGDQYGAGYSGGVAQQQPSGQQQQFIELQPPNQRHSANISGNLFGSSGLSTPSLTPSMPTSLEATSMLSPDTFTAALNSFPDPANPNYQ